MDSGWEWATSLILCFGFCFLKRWQVVVYTRGANAGMPGSLPLVLPIGGRQPANDDVEDFFAYLWVPEDSAQAYVSRLTDWSAVQSKTND
jgi:hypothetical protein